MYAIWVIVTLGMLTGAYALLDNQTLSSTPNPVNMNLAVSMSAYREAVVAYAQKNPAFQGQVPVGSLALPTGTQTVSLRNYVEPNAGGVSGSVVVIYGTAASSGTAALDIEQMAQGSALAGIAQAGSIQSPGNPAVPLPNAIAGAVPNGAVVWMAQAYL